MAKDKFKKKVLEEIKNRQVIPKGWWQMKRWGKRGIMAGMIMTGGMMMFGFMYYLDFYGLWDLWEFGQEGRSFFWESIPYWWLIGASVMVLIAVRWYREVDDNYKKNIIYRIIMIAGLNLILAGILAVIKNKWEMEIWMWLLKL